MSRSASIEIDLSLAYHAARGRRLGPHFLWEDSKYIDV